MCRTAVSTLALLSLSTLPTLAGPLDGVELSYSGQATIGQFEASLTDDAEFFDIELTGRLALASGIGIAFSADITDDFDVVYREAYTIYGFYEFAPGHEVQVGRLPSPIENFGPDERLGYSEAYEEFTLLLLRAPLLTIAQHGSDFETIGIGYQANFGGFNAAASVHFIEGPEDELYSLAVWYDGMSAGGLSYTLGLGAERLTSSIGINIERLFTALDLSYGAFDLAVEASVGDAFFAPIEASVVDVSLRYNPQGPALDGFAIGADYTWLEAGGVFGTVEFYGIGVEYTHASGLGVGLSAGRNDFGAFTEEVMGVEAFFRF